MKKVDSPHTKDSIDFNYLIKHLIKGGKSLEYQFNFYSIALEEEKGVA
ncbi:hypothetical protein [Pueribacillus theae]|nr:hypothetical protein [Pueribacillus theae]